MAEKRLIDANALKIHRMHNTGANHPLDVAYRKDIDNAPTVDAVEVVRCKECKHSTWDEEEHLWECTNSYDLTGDADTYAMFHEYNDGEHFCSYGERKDND